MTVKAWKRKQVLMRKLARSACRLLAGAGDIPKPLFQRFLTFQDMDFSALELRVAQKLRIDAENIDGKLKAILTEPTPPEEAAQRLAGTYMTRKEKKAALFGFVYGQRGVTTGRLPSLPVLLQQAPRRKP